jgi:hypothetical protein
LRLALEDGDAQRVFVAAHALGNAVLNFTRGRAAEIVRDIESLARAGDLAACREANLRLGGLLDELVAELEETRSGATA